MEENRPNIQQLSVDQLPPTPTSARQTALLAGVSCDDVPV